MSARDAAVRAVAEALCMMGACERPEGPTEDRWHEMQARLVLNALATNTDVRVGLVAAPCRLNGDRDQMCGHGTWAHPGCVLAALGGGE